MVGFFGEFKRGLGRGGAWPVDTKKPKIKSLEIFKNFQICFGRGVFRGGVGVGWVGGLRGVEGGAGCIDTTKKLKFCIF